MNNSTPRLLFALLCAVGFCVILGGAWWETARFRRLNDRNDSMPRQLRMRLASAVLWLLLFGLSFYATLFLFPTAAPHSALFKSQARTWALTMAGAFSLLFPALILLLLDIKHTARERREQQINFHRDMAQVLRERAQKSKTSSEEIES